MSDLAVIYRISQDNIPAMVACGRPGLLFTERSATKAMVGMLRRSSVWGKGRAFLTVNLYIQCILSFCNDCVSP